MIPRSALPEELRSRASRLRKLLSEDGFLHASLVEMKRRCGKPYCRCTRGELHRSLYLCHSRRATTRMRYVPVENEAQVREWVARYKEARQLLDEIAQFYWEQLAAARE